MQKQPMHRGGAALLAQHSRWDSYCTSAGSASRPRGAPALQFIWCAIVGLRLLTRHVLDDRELNPARLGQRDEGPVALADDKYVGHTRGEGVPISVLDVDNLEGSRVPLARGDHADAAAVLAANDHRDIAHVELEEVGDLARLDVELDHVVLVNARVRVADRPAVMRNDVGHLLGAQLDGLDLAQLVFGLLRLDAVDGEAAAHVVEHAEVLVRFLERNDVHEASRVAHLGARLAVHGDETLLHDHLRLLVRERVLEAVAQQHNKRDTLACLVRTG
mmetsp:Transcript_15758/g.40169  ORF Transcript_15758/g.40169 Transcript_15758/m.40169 type:complete len:275 (-) Transcript_15758:155-979(-)